MGMGRLCLLDNGRRSAYWIMDGFAYGIMDGVPPIGRPEGLEGSMNYEL